MIEGAAPMVADSPSAALPAGELLAEARVNQQSIRAAELHQLVLAAAWVSAHPATTLWGSESSDAATFRDDRSGVEEHVTAPGCPTVTESAAAEWGAALGLSTLAAKRMLGHAIELQYRLPRTWARLQQGTADMWRARLVAEATLHAFPAQVSDRAVAWVDTQVAPILGKVSNQRILRILDEARLRFDIAPDPVSTDPTHAVIDIHAITSEGTTTVHAELHLADALDLENALRNGAAELKNPGSTAPLDVRRATALGDLARAHTSLRLWEHLDVTRDENDTDNRTGTGARLGDASERAHLRPRPARHHSRGQLSHWRSETAEPRGSASERMPR